MDITLERFIDERYSLLITKDFNYLNAGVFMLRVNDWSRQYMREVLAMMSKGSNEQDWMIGLLEEEEFESGEHLLACQDTLSLYEMYRPGDFAIHWAGHNYSPKSFEDWQMGRFIKLPF
ncbi:hypothetical protein BGX21_011453 [Mortierella sp. AD011]|nr:hypothetical protein BGX21_011453 [Mortierella sp. AD011]